MNVNTPDTIPVVHPSPHGVTVVGDEPDETVTLSPVEALQALGELEAMRDQLRAAAQRETWAAALQRLANLYRYDLDIPLPRRVSARLSYLDGIDVTVDVADLDELRAIAARVGAEITSVPLPYLRGRTRHTVADGVLTFEVETTEPDGVEDAEIVDDAVEQVVS